jgi:hypothetical protein
MSCLVNSLNLHVASVNGYPPDHYHLLTSLPKITRTQTVNDDNETLPGRSGAKKEGRKNVRQALKAAGKVIKGGPEAKKTRKEEDADNN